MASNIPNWREVLKPMIGHYYEYNGYVMLFLGFELSEGGGFVEINTNQRDWKFSFNSMPTVLPKWHPLNYNDVDIFDHVSYSQELLNKNEADINKHIHTSGSQKSSKKSSYERLRDEAFKMVSEQKELNSSILGKMNEMLGRLNPDKPSPTDINILKHIATAGNQASKMEANQIRALHALKDIVMPKGKVIEDKNNDDQNSENPEENKNQ